MSANKDIKVNNIPAISFEEGVLYLPESLDLAREFKTKNEPVLVNITICEDSFEFPYVYEGDELPPKDYLRTAFCRQKGIPLVIADLDEFRIREEKTDDLDALYEIYNDSDVRRFLEPLNSDKNAEKISREVYIKQQYNVFGFGMWVIEEVKSGQIVGRVGFEQEDSDNVYLGFVIKKEYRHRGLATRCIKASLDYMQRNFPEFKISAVCKSENTAAIMLCQLLGVEVKTI